MGRKSNHVGNIAAPGEPLAPVGIEAQVDQFHLASLFFRDGGKDLHHERLIDAEKHEIIELRKQK